MTRKTDNAGQDVCRRRDCCCYQTISAAPGLRQTLRYSHNYTTESHLSSLQSLSHQSLNGTISPLCPCQGSPALGSSSHRTQKIIRNNVTQILFLHNDQWVAEKVHCLLCEVSGFSFTTSLLCRVTLANKQVYGQSRDQSGLVKSSRIFSSAISFMIAGSTAQHLGIRQSNYLGTSWN